MDGRVYILWGTNDSTMVSLTRLDENSHSILKDVRDEMKANGITGATFSDAVRELKSYRIADGAHE